MKIHPFNLISFKSEYWKKNAGFSILDNREVKDKAVKTQFIMDFLKESILLEKAVVDPEPSLYVLQIENSAKSVTSIIGEISSEDKEIFFPNEETHPDKLEVYRKMFSRYRMQVNPVLTFYREGGSVISITSEITKRAPDISANIRGAYYKLWKVNRAEDFARIDSALSKIQKIYIADGHHRFAMFHDENSKSQKRILISVTDASSIILKSCHRMITKTITPSWRKKIEEYCELKKIDQENALNSDKVVINFRNGDIYEIRFRYDKFQDTAMHKIIKNVIIHHSFEIENYHENVFPIAGNTSIQHSDQIFSHYKNGSAIIFVPDIQIAEFLKILDTGAKLPPTTTWFEPKLIDGFLISRY